MNGDGVHGAAHSRLTVLLVLRETAEDSLSRRHRAEDHPPPDSMGCGSTVTHIDHHLCVCVSISMHVHICGVHCIFVCMCMCMHVCRDRRFLSSVFEGLSLGPGTGQLG